MKYKHFRFLLFSGALLVSVLFGVGCDCIPGVFWIVQPSLREVNLVGKTRQDIIRLILTVEDHRHQYWSYGYEDPKSIGYTNKSPYYGGRFDRPLIYNSGDYKCVQLYSAFPEDDRRDIRKLMRERARYWLVFFRYIDFFGRAWCLEFDERGVVVAQTEVDVSSFGALF